MVLLFLSLAVSSQVTLDNVYAKVKTLPGVEIAAEMVRPSSVEMKFKIAPGGYFWAKYPTSEDFISLKEQVSWMPDRRQFARSARESLNPLPAGFESLWPAGELLTPNGEAKNTTFAGKSAVELPCKASAGHQVNLFVDGTSLLPLGSVATAGGVTYEIHYKTVKTTPISPRDLTFVAPSDARPLSSEPPDAKLIKPGAQLKPFRAKDADGKIMSSAQMLKGKRGLVLNFWFSACTGCVQEMPFLSGLEGKLRKQQVPLIGVNPIDPTVAVRKTAAVNKLPFTTIVGPDAKGLSQAMGVLAYPVTIVVNSKGQIVDAMMGFQEARLISALKKIGYVP